MQTITSTTNNIIKETAKLLLKKYRMQQRLFLLEGEKVLNEALSQNIEIQKLFILDEKISKYKNYNIENSYIVNEAVIKKISSTDSAPEVVAIAKQLVYSKNCLTKFSKIMLLENIKDAGNLGTIVRSASAFGIDSVILVGDCVDIYNPKVVRAAVGNLFRIPIFNLNYDEIDKYLTKHSFISTVVQADDTTDLKQIDFQNKFVLMLGSEADGLSQHLQDKANIKCNIKMVNNVESLNLSVAASIICYEIFNKVNIN